LKYNISVHAEFLHANNGLGIIYHVNIFMIFLQIINCYVLLYHICYCLKLFMMFSLSSAEQIYADTQPLIRSVLDGYNVCVFAYGQTGSGKTYTMVLYKHHYISSIFYITYVDAFIYVF
jgi:hypothetical protein